MRRLEADEIVDLERYKELRPEYRRAVIAHKKERRMAVGDRVTLLFEDRETLRFQVQEMLYVERISDPERVQDELDVYNELLPGAGELSATLFIEITDVAEIRPELDRLIGLDEHVSLRIGGDEDGEGIAADFDPKQLEEDRLSAVQYIRFRLDEAQCARFEDLSTHAAVRIDHPAYTALAEIPKAVRASLAAGLRGEPEPLLQGGPAPRLPERVLFETGRVRAVASPGGRAVVEARGGEHLDAALWAELADAVRRVSEELAGRGSVRIQADWDPDAGPPRWHVTVLDA